RASRRPAPRARSLAPVRTDPARQRAAPHGARDRRPPPQAPGRSRMKPNPRIILPVLLVAIVAIVVTLVMRRAGRGDLAASGTVEATETQLGFTVAGRIDAILVREGDAVARGQVLAVLDTAEAAARLAQTQAQGDAARALLLEMQHGSRPAEVSQ